MATEETPDATLLRLTVGDIPVAVVRLHGGVMTFRWGAHGATAPFDDDEVSGLYLPGDYAVLAGRLPTGAITVEAVARDGARVAGTVSSGVWGAVLPDNHRGIEAYPVLFRGSDGAPVKRSIPAAWERQAAHRDEPCPACGATAWDVITAEWVGEGPLRTTRWGHFLDNPGRAYVCRVCGHQHPFGSTHTYQLGDHRPAREGQVHR